jgi:hypothetical protein
MGENSLGRGPGGNFPRIQNDIWSNDQRKNESGLFVKIESAGIRKVSEVNPIIVEKWIQQVADGYKECNRTRKGDLVLLTKNKAQAERMIKITEIPTGPDTKMTVRIKLMDFLNTSKGTIYSREILNIPLEGADGLTDCLSKFNVVKVERIKSKDKEGQLRENGLHILTFGSRTPLEEIKIGYMRHEVRTWYPDPMKCIKCMKFGHSRARCNAANNRRFQKKS